MATASLLVVGGEMLDPERRDANGPVARERLLAIGIPLVLLTRVEDRPAVIADALRAALEASDIVITSGGLGPTGDDVTREGVAAALGRQVIESPEWSAVLEARLRQRGRDLTQAGRRQALSVTGAELVPNERGLACGAWLEHAGKVVVMLPGIPTEFVQMLDDFVAPRLAARHPDSPRIRVVRAIFAGLPEADAEPLLAPWYARPGVAVSVLPSSGVLKVTLTFTAPPAGDIDTLAAEAEDALRRGLEAHLVSLDGSSLEQSIGDLLMARGWTLSAAESCTGGAGARKIVSVPGASRYFVGGVAAYNNLVKEELLGVPKDVLAQAGAVSEETALAMVRGARRLFHTSCAFATTGVAGPDGGTPAKPVGLVYVAAATPEQESVRKLFYPVDRQSVIELSSNYALYQLWRPLRPPRRESGAP